jgi:hypothetical protein
MALQRDARPDARRVQDAGEGFRTGPLTSGFEFRNARLTDAGATRQLSLREARLCAHPPYGLRNNHG